MRAKQLAVAVRAAALKVTHHRRIDTGRVKPKRFQSPIEQISCSFVSGGKNAKISSRNTEILPYARHFQRVAICEFIYCRSFLPNDFHCFKSDLLARTSTFDRDPDCIMVSSIRATCCE